MADGQENEIANLFRQHYLEQVGGELRSHKHQLGDVEVEIFWKPLVGSQQEIIQKASDKSIAKGICTHVKNRALDKDGNLIFKSVPLVSMMNDFDFEKDIAPIFFAMTGVDLDIGEIEKN